MPMCRSLGCNHCPALYLYACQIAAGFQCILKAPAKLMTAEQDLHLRQCRLAVCHHRCRHGNSSHVQLICRMGYCSLTF